MTQNKLISFSLALIAIILFFVALKLAQSITAPLTLALVVGVVLSPLSDGMERLGVSAVFRTILTLGVGLAVLALLFLLLEPVVQSLVIRAPIIWHELRETIEWFSQILRGINEVSGDVAEAVNGPTATQPAAAAENLTADLPNLTDALFLAPMLAAHLMIFIGSLFFFVLSRKEIYRWITNLLKHSNSIDAADGFLEQAERLVARYFVTISLINAALGAIVAAVMHLIGMPSPVLWGVLAFSLNYVPYLGPLAFALTLLVAGTVAFDGSASLLPMLAYIAINVLEGQFVTPALVGRHMRVNPLLIFLSLVFWLWLWGPIGGFIAIPLLVWAIAITKALHAQDMPAPDTATLILP